MQTVDAGSRYAAKQRPNQHLRRGPLEPGVPTAIDPFKALWPWEVVWKILEGIQFQCLDDIGWRCDPFFPHAG